MFKTAKAKKRRFSDVLNVFKRFSNNSKTPPSKIEHKNEIARKTEDFLIFRAIFLTLQFSFTFLFLSHSTQNITHFRHFLPLPIQFHPFPPFSTFLRFPCQLTFGTLMDTKHNPAWKKIRQVSDAVCKEMGLSVVAYGEIGKGVLHYEWTKQQQGLSWKEKLRYELDCIIQRSDTFEDFLEKCRLNGIETVYKPENTISLKFRMQGQQRFARAKTLGYYYLPENIQRRIRQFSSHRKMILDRDKFDNRGLQYWADIQNMKNVAQMINLLESYNVHSTSELKLTTMTVMARRGMITQSIENLDKKINILSEQIELVRQFQRSKPYHDKYKSLSAWKQKEYAKKNAPVLEKYKSVGSQLKLLYPDGRFPSKMVLDRQRQALYEEREKLYEEYRYLKKEYADLNKASQTIDDYLESLRDEPEHKRKKGELE